jgi:hypothetical protein
VCVCVYAHFASLEPKTYQKPTLLYHWATKPFNIVLLRITLYTFVKAYIFSDQCYDNNLLICIAIKSVSYKCPFQFVLFRYDEEYISVCVHYQRTTLYSLSGETNRNDFFFFFDE